MALFWVEEHEGRCAFQSQVTAPVRTQGLGIVVEEKAIYAEMNTVSLLRSHSTLWEVLGNGGVLDCHTDAGAGVGWGGHDVVLLVLLDRGAKDAQHAIMRLSHTMGFVLAQLQTVCLLMNGAGLQRKFQVCFLKNQLVHWKPEIIFQGSWRDWMRTALSWGN